MPEHEEDSLVLFERLVRQEFSFLESEYGFQGSFTEPAGHHGIGARYRSNKVYVDIGYGPPGCGCELSLSLGRVGVDDIESARGFSGSDLSYLDEEMASPEESEFLAYEPENLRINLSKMARMLRERGRACLQGDDAAYAMIATRRREAEERSAKKRERDDLARKAEAAFKDRDFGRVIELYSSIESDLTELERKRLLYARSHQAKGANGSG